MENKNLIIILSIIVVILAIFAGYVIFDKMNQKTIEYEKYTVNGTNTTIEIPVHSKIVENDDLVNISNDEGINIMILKNTSKKKDALIPSQENIMEDKLNKDTKELVQVYSSDKEVRDHIIDSIKFGKVVKTEKTETSSTTTKEVDHSNDPVYCAHCGAYVATQYEIDNAPGAGYFHDPNTGQTICYDCAAKLMAADEAENEKYEMGEQDDGGYVDSEGNHWSSYDEYLFSHNHPNK